jgi:hypothetical protein
MSQNISTISLEDFEAKLPKMSFSALKQLIETIANLTQGNISDFVLRDLLRKETKIWSELQKRKVWTKVNKKALSQFFHWRWNELKYRKKLY